MTRIDFYVLVQGARDDRLGLTCRLTERIRAKDHRVLIHCADLDTARKLDRRLWTFRDGSFLPHGLVGEINPAYTPVIISTDGEPADEDQVLINLSPEVPEFFARFERLCEPLDHDPLTRQAGRRRWRYYAECGYAMQHHEIR